MSTRENRSGKNTKKWILETALNLFNEHGSQAISTKRIAKEMGISPGNVYYHFKNKKEIIHAIVINSCGDAKDSSEAELPPVQDFLEAIHGILLSWKNYPFFKRELYVLLKTDSLLHDWYENVRKKSISKFNLFFHECINTKKLQDSNVTVDSLFTSVWLIAEHWINYLEIRGEPITEKWLLAGIDQIVQVLFPYLNKIALNEINKFRKGLLLNESS